jgi:hypothetical protein
MELGAPPLFLRSSHNFSKYIKQSELEGSFRFVSHCVGTEPVVPAARITLRPDPFQPVLKFDDNGKGPSRPQTENSSRSTSRAPQFLQTTAFTSDPGDALARGTFNLEKAQAPPRTSGSTPDRQHAHLTCTSPRIEHRYRNRFVASDGTQNLSVEPPRLGPLSQRWRALDAAWDRPFRTARAAPIPCSRAAASAAAARSAFPRTGDFRNDSVFSAARRARAGEALPTETAAAAPWAGRATARETEQQRIGEWAADAGATRRVRTAGTRCFAHNYPWGSGP